MANENEVGLIVDQRNQSRQWMQANYWDEFEDVYRAVKCRTKPYMITNSKGEEVEDKTRTNVAMPELALMARRKTARLTANPPQINYVSPSGDPQSKEVEQKLTALAFQQFDRSGEAAEHKRLVQSGQIFGWGVTKTFWDTIEVMRRVRKDPMQMRDRKQLMEFQGKGEDEINAAVDEKGSEITDDELKELIAQEGDEISGQENVKKYEGPVVRNVFIGDVFLEPGCRSLNESGFVVENYQETDLWLQKMVRKRYEDPDSGQLIPVFSEEAAVALISSAQPSPTNNSQQPFDLRTKLRTMAQGQTLPSHSQRILPGRRFDILERHQRDKYGMMWITWVGNESVYLGKMCYPFDLYGKYLYTEFTPLPDMLNFVGDSAPRLMRWLHLLHNVTVGQRKDLVNQILRPMFKMKFGEDIPDEVLERRLMRIIQCKDMNSLQPLTEPSSVGPAISAAVEEEQQLMMLMNMFEPTLNNTNAGSDANPQAGKTATTAVLAAKSADALTQDEINQLNVYLKEVGEKKLWMNQQLMDQQPIMPQYANKVSGLSQRYGKASQLTLDPMEIQEDLQVEPEVMSMLSVDDDIKRQGAMQLMQFAMADPITWNKEYAAQQLALTIRGIDPEKAVNPPQPPTPPAPKVNIAIAVKWAELPSEVQAQMLQENGIQVTPEVKQELDHEETLKGVQKVSLAADAAANIMSPADQPDKENGKEPSTNVMKEAGVDG